VSVTDTLEPFTLPLSIPPLVLLELVEAHVPESDAADCEIVARMFPAATRLSLVVPTHVPSTLADVELGLGPDGRPHADAPITNRTTQARVNIDIRAPEWIELRLRYTVPESQRVGGEKSDDRVHFFAPSTKVCPRTILPLGTSRAFLEGTAASTVRSALPRRWSRGNLRCGLAR
jgi:hypothetical protein